MLHLKTITKDNWIKAISLKVREDQVKFVASNTVSLAQLNFLENFHAKGIYYGEEMVGFTLYGIDEDDNEYWIYRMMIDQKHQGKGYGKEAVQLVIEDIRAMKEPHNQTISLSYEPDNEHAKRIYEKMGFREIDGFVIEGEQVARYTY
ncbi:diamine N-acetyltransferase [Solibacillus kalamii]|uniref:Histone acetyltransferase HPA2 n=3 Tax=Solibacillus TaxID=648800 RepID=F2F897_SOLSS|nr:MULTISPECIES: GNAT family N-acetyltransferase [Solibacillus]AMO84193.1 spermidine acetyltransferase [Solibacillus silvestris]EKB46181.1 Spermine/spermidine acetyltransferase [Solibacillus isronensis B3W22]MBM7664684.1 diamine N-acetyltransferase [Solibacillus kalamii]OBW58992.1 spermidine acetyltransferase [Solibacillus silvestris]OUZ40938.1 N-acetyltransferase [Solibacillus kalamii]